MPLKRRKSDISRLTVYYVNRLCEIYNSKVKGLSNDYLDALEKYPWPGNVRELFNTLEESLSLVYNEFTLQKHHLPVRLRATITRHTVIKCTPAKAKETDINMEVFHDGAFPSISAFRERMERLYLQKLNQFTQGNRKEACRLSGLSRTRLLSCSKNTTWLKPLTQSTCRRFLRFKGSGRMFRKPDMRSHILKDYLRHVVNLSSKVLSVNTQPILISIYL